MLETVCWMGDPFCSISSPLQPMAGGQIQIWQQCKILSSLQMAEPYNSQKQDRKLGEFQNHPLCGADKGMGSERVYQLLVVRKIVEHCVTSDKQNMKNIVLLLMFLEAARPQSQTEVLGVCKIHFMY